MNDPAKLILKLMSLAVVLVWLSSVLITFVFIREIGYWAVIPGMLAFGVAGCCTAITARLWSL